MTDTISLDIKGMTCGHCKKAVTEALQQIDGVKNVEVDLDKGGATVEAAPNTNPQQLVNAVEEEGYDATIR